MYKLTSNSTDAAVVLGELNTITLGAALKTEGEGSLSYLGRQYTTNSMIGSSFFGLVGFEYEVPLPVLPTVEVVAGYKENRLTFKDFTSGSNTLSNSVKIKTVQYLFGFGMVF